MNSAPKPVDEILAAAVEIAADADRLQYLDQACGGDTRLRREVEELLVEHRNATGFMEKPAAAYVATVGLPPITEQSGTSIGPYKLIEPIGEGGMGLVYMARQREPVKRNVALKIIKPGMDSWQVVARFEAERQALAMMDHPNIARILDGGATQSGLPYFVMDLVCGMPITQYCDQQHVTTRGRLELFVTVCQAVQHAHQKGIIHRDIKPSNVLITLHDGTPVPKVIDFGVAKALHQPLTDDSIVTGFQQLVGTPLYMSPEQAELSGLDIDTRSDVYSLGVLLYELLTGLTPFDRKQFSEASLDEMRRIIREDEPPRPSTRVSTLDAAGSSTISQQRGIDSRQLGNLLRGELDWIVMRSLEKDRTRRYQSAGDLARDAQRYLEDEPVEACPPTRAYRFRKFARRNKVVLTATALVTAALITGTGVATWQAIKAHEQAERATRAEELAQARLAQVKLQRDAAQAAEQRASLATIEAERSRDQSELSEKQAEEVTNYLVGIFRSSDPERGGPSITAAEVLELAADDLKRNNKLAEQPLIKARLLAALGASCSGIGLFENAEDLYRRAVEIQQKLLGMEHPRTLMSMLRLAEAYRNLGRYDEALALHQETLKLTREHLGEDHPDTVRAMNNLASAYRALGRYQEAIDLYEEVVRLRREHLGVAHPTTLASMNKLAEVYRDAGRPGDVLKLLEEVYQVRREHQGAGHPDTIMAMNVLSAFCRVVGRHEEALALLETAISLAREHLGTSHSATLATMGNLAVIYGDIGRKDEAVKLQEETLALLRTHLGEYHRQTLMTMHNLAGANGDLGRGDEAIELYRRTLELMCDHLGKDDPDTLIAMNSLASAHRSAGHDEEAIELFQEALRLRRARLGSGHPKTLETLQNLAQLYDSASCHAEAQKLHEELVHLRRQTQPGSPQVAGALAGLALTLLHQQKAAEAESPARESLEIRRQSMPGHWLLFNSMCLLGRSLMGQKKYAEAEQLLLDGCRGLIAREQEIPAAGKPRIAEATAAIVQLYEDWGKPEEADKWREHMAQENGDETTVPNTSKD